jgi:predicted transcriptional regulator
MEMQSFSVVLPPDLVQKLETAAARRDVTPGQIIRELLVREFSRSAANKPNRADEQLVARLQRLLASDMASATSWNDIQSRLAGHGYQLRPAGGGLTLHDARGRRLCKSSELGFAYSRLVRKFGAPMPGHPHRMQRLLNNKVAEAAPDDPPELFEPF